MEAAVCSCDADRQLLLLLLYEGGLQSYIKISLLKIDNANYAVVCETGCSSKLQWLCSFSNPLMVLNCGCSAVRMSSKRRDSAVVKLTLGVSRMVCSAIVRSYALNNTLL